MMQKSKGPMPFHARPIKGMSSLHPFTQIAQSIAARAGRRKPIGPFAMTARAAETQARTISLLFIWGLMMPVPSISKRKHRNCHSTSVISGTADLASMKTWRFVHQISIVHQPTPLPRRFSPHQKTTTPMARAARKDGSLAARAPGPKILINGSME